MCAACVAEGTMYVGGAAVSLRVMASRAATRRARGLLPPLSPEAPAPEEGESGPPGERFSTGTPHL